MMASRIADIIKIIMLAAGPHAALAGGSAGIIALFFTGEQALKLHHAGIGKEQGWVTIHLVVKHDKVLLKIRNSMEQCEHPLEEEAPVHTGLGIEAVRKLLDVSFRKSYYLEARPIGNVYAVDLIIGRVAA